MKRLLFLLLPAVLAAPTTLLAQRKKASPPPAATPAPPPEYQRLPSDTEYKLYRRDAAGRYQPRPATVPTDSAYSTRTGRFLLAHVSYLTGRDSVLQSSRKQLKGQAAPVPLQPVTRPGGPEEAFALLLPGDSAVFRFSADSLFKGRPVPPELKRSGNVLVMQVAVTGLVRQDEAMGIMQRIQQQAQAEQQREAQAHAAAQLPKDNAAIAAYLIQHQLTAQQTPGGTFYIINKRGTGPLPQVGQPVKVKYKGTVLATGKEFDSSEKHGGEPFEFTLGRGQVIQGWDQGIAVLPVGSTATLLIPSALAYGARGAGADIPADAPLRFDVEVVSAGAAPAPAAKKPATTAKKPVVKKAVAPAKKAPVRK